jgi:sugar lactone lactonase YvrE
MRRLTLVIVVLALAAPIRAQDPSAPIVWTAKDLAALETKIKGAVDPARHLGLERLLASGTLIYRDGPSEAEIHTTLADFITVRSGEGYIQVGGEIVDAKTTAPGEMRGPSIRGGTRINFAAGDSLYMPANMVHQFFVDPGRNYTMTIVKITPRVDPVPNPTRNDLPQPYRTTRDWGELPAGLKRPAVTAVEASPDGSIYVVQRCFENSCAGRSEPAILKYDARGKLLASWGQGMFVFPHGAAVDRDGNLWVTDGRGADGKGHQVFKFSPDGKVLMTLGRAGVAGSGVSDAGTMLFDQPTDVVVSPAGDIFVTDSHRNGRNNRVVRFTRDGTFVKEWGRKGTGAGELSEPHTIAIDSRGRLFVGDRENNRIVIYDQEGTVLDTWHQFGRPSGIAITRDDTIYVTDSESGPNTGARELAGIRKGIRIGSARTGMVTAFIEDSESTVTDHSGAEGVGVDARGNVYGAVVRRQMLERYVRR